MKQVTMIASAAVFSVAAASAAAALDATDTWRGSILVDRRDLRMRQTRLPSPGPNSAVGFPAAICDTDCARILIQFNNGRVAR